MRKCTINLPRGLEVDIFNLPEDFKEQVEQAITECGLPLNIRGEALTLEQFAALADIFVDMK